MEEMMRLLRDLSTKVNKLEKAVTPRGAPVSPEQPLRRSVFRQAIEEGGSLGMHQMHLDELGGVQVGLGVQTPGAWARGDISRTQTSDKRYRSTRCTGHRR
ncbi:hypothetical protein PF002_g7872 [Phytophthora fragariae]|uniref:Uncharacterized protein n=1 Tax=Phytophthora fragariae TaxID=53985 RepID=A0A6A3ZUB7_9STRA|nr:hypothetical protein PF003_g20298 [Phytophthora fragariae]KAE9123052.1 hypothetical protein PF007_g7212 [Phytophthora fragariae]KAE9123053.1 hypothetical protein PF007_g7211 [Phytophthora fragariae]KAE9244273.1 hypothetical protein PF002_g7872 [Phytophthora fragariae]